MIMTDTQNVGDRESITLTCPMCGDASRRVLLVNDDGEPLLPTVVGWMVSVQDAVLCERCGSKVIQSSAARDAMVRRKSAEQRSILADGMTRARFDTSDSEKVRAHAEAFHVARHYDGTKTLWIHGMKGTGKTWVAHSIMNAWMDDGGSVGEVNSAQICILAKMYGSRIEERMTDLVAVDLLLIDDIDSAEWTAPAVDILRDIVDRRRSANRPMIVTAQRTGRETKARLTDLTNHTTAVESMIDRFMPLVSIEMTGRSYRLEEQTELVQPPAAERM